MFGKTSRIVWLDFRRILIAGTKSTTFGPLFPGQQTTIPPSIPTALSNIGYYAIVVFTNTNTNIYYPFCYLGLNSICRYYWRLMSEYLSNGTSSYIRLHPQCDSLAVNMVASHACRRPPVKIGPRYGPLTSRTFDQRISAKEASFLRDECLRDLVQEQFGYQPLKRSAVRADPLLFKDPVSIHRKKYRKMENVT